MKSAKNLTGLDTVGQNGVVAKSSSDAKQTRDKTMVLVYPDGRITNVQLRQNKSCV